MSRQTFCIIEISWCLVYEGNLWLVQMFFFFLEDIVAFVVPLIPLFWTCSDFFPGFQSQGGSPRLSALSPVCNGFFKFIPGMTPVDLLAISIMVEQFWSMYLQKSRVVALPRSRKSWTWHWQVRRSTHALKPSTAVSHNGCANNRTPYGLWLPRVHGKI